MQPTDEYELMPREELDYLRKEVDKLKRNPLGDTQASISLLDALNKLSVSVTKLNNVFEGANDEMVKSFNDTAMQEQLVKMLEQQERLAKGIVAVAELVKELEKKLDHPIPTFDQFVPPKATVAAQAVQAPTASAQPMMMQAEAQATAIGSKNPFEMDHAPAYQPIMADPLPRPGGGNIPPPPRMQNLGGIPDMDVPPPPPRRQY